MNLLGTSSFIRGNSWKYLPRFSFGYIKGAPYVSPIDIPLSQYFKEIVDKGPSSIALHSYDQNVTFNYQEAYDKAVSLATGFVEVLKLQPRDRIGIYSYNKWEWYIVQMAAAFADLILVNINPAYQSEELAYTIDKVSLKALILGDQYRHMDYIKIVKSIVPELE